MVRSPAVIARTLGAAAAEARRRVVHRRGARGASLVEYALLLALLAIACIAAVDVIGGSAGAGLSDSGSRIANG